MYTKTGKQSPPALNTEKPIRNKPTKLTLWGIYLEVTPLRVGRYLKKVAL
jgi:hypothetical protein